MRSSSLYTRNFPGALSKLEEIARNSDLVIVLFVHFVISRSNYFGIGFATVI